MEKLTVRGISTHEESKGEWKCGYLIEDEGVSYIVNGVVEANDEYITIGEWCSVEPETLGLSTGLLDKDGREIFEGDILGIETDEGKVRVNVFWDSKHALFMFESKRYNEKNALAELVEDNAYPFKIIGNIYENQKLLGE